jgi:F-type H+-transporting ATPase subunit b
MHLITPDLGTMIWMLLVFGTVLFILGKFAWKPILGALSQREAKIENALKAAENAKKEMAKLQASNEKILAEAKKERDELLKEAREMKDKLIADAKVEAAKQTEAMIVKAKESIENEKAAMVNDIRQQIAIFSVDIAEKLLRQKLSSDDQQSEMVKKLVDEIKLN